MLWGEGLLVSFSGLLVFLLLVTRSTQLSVVLTGGLYLLLVLFRFEPIPESRAQHVLKPQGKVSTIAHRGGAHDAPENTLAAIRLAAQNGAVAVELDLEFTKDRVPILMHDDTVERTTDGFGKLSDLTFAEVRKLNPAANHRLRHLYKNEKVPTLREAVEECLHHNLVIYFDVKGHAAEAAEALRKLYIDFPRLYNCSIVCSFEPSVIYKMRQADINVVTALTHRLWSLSHLGDGKPRFDSFWKHYFYVSMDVLLDWGLHHILWNLCGVSALLMQKNYISIDYVEKWNKRGVEVVAWTVNTATEKLHSEHVLHSNFITDSMVEDCDPHY
ncbi:glycerophosphodiester phosphodiesterase 1 isoform X1 [Hyla sarda]|uniref:glycerophosphodiester phosphodiesterase 1 isoform X1 n=1 Tax=Hyla sarda TaxID=327740 RepID=UPI0024C22813|nr:glycerophosphodiester phosphodiesterase 1 isoform X1 [Hyla sarda]